MTMKKIINIVKKKWFLLFIGFSIVASLLLLNGDLPVSMDGPLYVTLARSIAFQHAYKDICYPTEPNEGTEHPFLYPLFLSFILIFLPKSVIGLKLVSAAFGYASLGAIYYFFFNEADNFEYENKKFSFLSMPILVLLFTSINLWFIFFTVEIIPETMFLLFSIIAILSLRKYKEQTRYFNKYLVFGVFSLVSVFYTKTMGIFLVLSVIIYFILHKRYRKAAIVTSLSSLFILPWFIYKIVLVFSNPVNEMNLPQGYILQIWYGHKGSIINLAKTIPWNIIQYAKSIVHLLMPGYFLDMPSFEGEGYFRVLYSSISVIKKINIPVSFPFFYFLIIIFFSGLVLTGFLSRVKKRDLIEVYFSIYLFILILCPPNYYFVGGTRYIFPLLPFLLYYLWTAVFLLKKKLCLSKQLFKVIILVIFIIYSYANLVPLVWAIRGNLDYVINKKWLPLKEKSYYYSSSYFIYWSAATWIKRNTSIDDVIMSYDAPAFYLFSDRKTSYFYHGRYQLDTEKRNIIDIDSEIEKNNVKYITADTESVEILKQLNYYSGNKIFVPIVKFKTLHDTVVEIYKVDRVDPGFKQLIEEGVYWYNQGKGMQAILKFNEALKIESNFIAYFNLGICYERINLPSEALINYKKSIKLQPNYEIAKNRFNILEYKEKLKQKPEDVLLWNNLGESYFKNYDYESAIECFTKAVTIKDSFGDVYYKLGVAYVYEYDFDNAILSFKEALKLDPSLKYKIGCYIKIIKIQKKEEMENLYNEAQELIP